MHSHFRRAVFLALTISISASGLPMRRPRPKRRLLTPKAALSKPPARSRSTVSGYVTDPTGAAHYGRHRRSQRMQPAASPRTGDH